MKVTGAQIEAGVALVERVLGSPFAVFLLTAARQKFAGDLTTDEKLSLDGNFAEGLARRADAFDRANRA